MTSMLLTASSTCSSDMASAPCLASHHLLAFTRRNALFLRIIKGRVLVHFGQHCPIRLNPIGDEFPVLPVPFAGCAPCRCLRGYHKTTQSAPSTRRRPT